MAKKVSYETADKVTDAVSYHFRQCPAGGGKGPQAVGGAHVGLNAKVKVVEWGGSDAPPNWPMTFASSEEGRDQVRRHAVLLEPLTSTRLAIIPAINA